MPGLVPGIHVFKTALHKQTWMAGTSPAMTKNMKRRLQPHMSFFSKISIAADEALRASPASD
jgi:hypothetical protein